MESQSLENSSEEVSTPESSSDPKSEMVELSESDQRWNSFVFILNYSIGYFVAPVFYVGVLHAAVLSSLGFSDTIANLPESVYIWMTPMPVLVAWYWPSTAYLRRMLVINYCCKASAGILAATLFLFAPKWLAVGIVLHAGVVGITNGVATMCLWELIGRGMTSARRGWTLGVTFGVGPVFAVLGSCGSQLILSGNFLDVIHLGPIPKPWCYVVLFGLTGPAMAVSAVSVFLAKIQQGTFDDSGANLAGIASGLRKYFTYFPIVIAICGFLLTSAGGNMIMNNLALFVRDATGELPEKYTGLQLALRFGCKSLSGFFLGWMLARYHAKLPALATTLFCLAGVMWALVIPGKAYLFSFGLLGAGELFYIYYLNYIVGCSAPERIRENTAYTNFIMIVVSFMPLLYGWISDTYGLRASFYLAIAILLAAWLIVGFALPKKPVTATSD